MASSTELADGGETTDAEIVVAIMALYNPYNLHNQSLCL